MALAEDAIAAIACHVRAALPGAAEAIRSLHRQGYQLHTASGSFSREVAGYLKGMGVQNCFGRFYGADLINTFKNGPAYYEHLFLDLGIKPQEALVVDDDCEALGWASQTGARAMLVYHGSPREIKATPQIGSLTELSAFLRSSEVGQV